MNQLLIANYIRKLTKEDIIQFSMRQNIVLTPQEVDVLYFYIKNRYQDFLNGYHQEILEELKPQLSSNTYEKILDYYYLYQNKF